MEGIHSHSARRVRHCLWGILVFLVGIFVAGCACPPVPEQEWQNLQHAGLVHAVGPNETVLADTWTVSMISSIPQGYAHRIIRAVNGSEPEVITAEYSLEHFRLRGRCVTRAVFREYHETPEGQLVSVRYVSHGPGAEKHHEARVLPDRIIGTATLLDRSAAVTAITSEKVLGPYGARLFLSQANFPLSKNYLREPKTFTYYNVSALRLERNTVYVTGQGQDEATVCGTKTHLRDARMSGDGAPGVSIGLVIDDNGDLVLSLWSPHEEQRVAREDVKREALGQEISDRLFSAVYPRADREIASPRKVTEAVYAIDFGMPVPAGLPIEGGRQTIVATPSPRKIEVRVSSTIAPDPPPGPEYLAPSLYVQSDDPAIVQLAMALTRNAKSPMEKARRLERWVHRKISKTYGIPFASAKETLLAREGDCTEHALLLAALLRAVGIPSRVAGGFVYAGERRFGLHEWTEAYVDGWVPLDAVIGGSFVDATHIRISAYHLNGACPDHGMDWVACLGKVHVAVLDLKYGP